MTNPDIKNPRAEHNFVRPHLFITAVGSYVPEKVLTNAALEELVDTNDEWIMTRTGIRERRIAADDEYTSDLGAKAAKIALERANVDPADVDLIILATITPDMPFPATACLVQEKIGAFNSAAFDVEATAARIRLRSGNRPAVYPSPHVQHRARDRRRETFLHHRLAGPKHLRTLRRRRRCSRVAKSREQPRTAPACAWVPMDARPPSSPNRAAEVSIPRVDNRYPIIPLSENGRPGGFQKRSNSNDQSREGSTGSLRVGVNRCIYPHQANMRILKAVGDRLGASEEQVFSNLQKYGNTSAASVAICAG